MDAHYTCFAYIYVIRKEIKSFQIGVWSNTAEKIIKKSPDLGPFDRSQKLALAKIYLFIKKKSKSAHRRKYSLDKKATDNNC